MIIKDGHGIPQESLRQLWQEAFGDSDAFLDLFFAHGFSPDRTRVAVDGSLLSALYWFDCTLEGEKYAYIYAAATFQSQRGKGIFRTLLEDTHRHLQALGYGAAMLVSAPGLEGYYGSFGYTFATGLAEVTCTPAKKSLALRTVTAEAYGRLRKDLLPPDAVVQEGASLAFLAQLAELYAGEGCLMAVTREKEKLQALEFLGDAALAPAALAALQCREGVFRMPGSTPFAMWKPLKPQLRKPSYFAFSFD